MVRGLQTREEGALRPTLIRTDFSDFSKFGCWRVELPANQAGVPDALEEREGAHSTTVVREPDSFS